MLKRPHVDEFLQRMGELFECVLFTASLAKVSPHPQLVGNAGTTLPSHLLPPYPACGWLLCPRAIWATCHPRMTCFPPPQYADPVADLLDKWGAFRARLFRESCVFHRGNYVKDLSRLGRDLRRVLILDNSPASYVFHPDNAVSAGGDLGQNQPFSCLGLPQPRSPGVWGLVGAFPFLLHCPSTLSTCAYGQSRVPPRPCSSFSF